MNWTELQIAVTKRLLARLRAHQQTCEKFLRWAENYRYKRDDPIVTKTYRQLRDVLDLIGDVEVTIKLLRDHRDRKLGDPYMRRRPPKQASGSHFPYDPAAWSDY